MRSCFFSRNFTKCSINLFFAALSLSILNYVLFYETTHIASPFLFIGIQVLLYNSLGADQVLLDPDLKTSKRIVVIQGEGYYSCSKLPRRYGSYSEVGIPWSRYYSCKQDWLFMVLLNLFSKRFNSCYIDRGARNDCPWLRKCPIIPDSGSPSLDSYKYISP